jgi:hypothetical protein
MLGLGHNQCGFQHASLRRIPTRGEHANSSAHLIAENEDVQVADRELILTPPSMKHYLPITGTVMQSHS